MNEEVRTEGIILRSTPFSDTKKILTVFMPEEGIVSLATKALSPQVSRLASATAPLTRSEFLFRHGKGEVHRLLDATILESHLGLRDHIDKLDTAGQIAQLLLKTQFPGKPAPQLYELTRAFLNHLQFSIKPKNLNLSFQLKFLKHEGLFHSTHSFPWITPEEWQILTLLADSRSFAKIEEFPINTTIEKKIYQLFYDSICS